MDIDNRWYFFDTETGEKYFEEDILCVLAKSSEGIKKVQHEHLIFNVNNEVYIRMLIAFMADYYMTSNPELRLMEPKKLFKTIADAILILEDKIEHIYKLYKQSKQ